MEGNQKSENKEGLPARIEDEEYLNDLAKIDPSLFFPETWSTEQRNRGMEALSGGRRLKQGSISAIPRKCDPSTCPGSDKYCPVLKEGLDPSGYKCPVEMALVFNFAYSYARQLNVDLDDPEQIVEATMIRDLVDQDIQQIRKSEMLAQEGFIKENCVGLDANGTPVFKDELHAAVDYEDRILKRKKQILNALLATREAKAKYEMGEHIDQLSAKQMTELLQVFSQASFMEEERQRKALEAEKREEEFLSMGEDDIFIGEVEEDPDD